MDATKNIYSSALKPEKKTIKLRRKELDANTDQPPPDPKLIHQKKPPSRGVSPRAILKPMAIKPALPAQDMPALGKIGVNTSSVIKMPAARKMKLPEQKKGLVI